MLPRGGRRTPNSSGSSVSSPSSARRPGTKPRLQLLPTVMAGTKSEDTRLALEAAREK